MKLLETTKKLLLESELQPGKESLLLAVSGGLDSMVLLDLLHRSGHAGAVAHFDHGLRGEEGRIEQELVEAEAKKRELSFYPFQLTPPTRTPEKGIQHWAREERYRKLRELMNKKGFSGIATGHHADDRLETVLMGLLRGSGYRGIVGVPTEKDGVIRPLIRFEKAELKAHASEKELPYREDPSNRSDRYLRNRIRKQLLPPLKEGFPDQRKALLRSMELLEEAGKALEELGRDSRHEILEKGEKDQEYRIPIDRLKKCLYPRFLLFELLHPFGFPSERIGEVLEGLDRPPGARFPCGERELIRDRTHLILSPPRKHRIPEEGCRIPSPSEPGDSGLTMRVEERQEQGKGSPLPDHPHEALLDLQELHFPLTLRKVRRGDRFRPFGMEQGSKTVLEHLTDRKVPVHEKEHSLVLVDRKGRILWVVGSSIDERFKVTPGTERSLRVEHPG